MDENKIPVQAPSILQSEQILLELIHTERKGTKFSSSRFALTPLKILQMLSLGTHLKFSKVRIIHQIL
jgi:hypothetical protein